MSDEMQIESIYQVKKILLDSHYQVRPIDQKVPKLLQGLLIGELFAKLVRMNEGEYHRLLKRHMTLTLMAFSQEYMAKITKEVITTTDVRLDSPEALTKAIATWPILVVAKLIGIKVVDPELFLTQITLFSAAIVQPHDQKVVLLGNDALIALYEMLLPAKGPLKQTFMDVCAESSLIDESTVNDNLLGLFFQTLDGTSGLIAAMLKHLLSESSLSSKALLNWSLQHHAPIKNTKRFRGKEMLILPLQFKENALPFGSGRHECPGQFWAKTIAITIVEYLRALPIEKCWLLKSRYKTSPNAQVLEFYS
ncbi:hypothetical protein MMG00_03520 [Ignatzschineria rhizosphaerae]|uniref:Cytochrome P450 n=1 Tax=Ignatzschineria rhizosphaerae TaxID=2923279 RepID=A0ABY3X5B6_9GAMM|nr:hypothetical protein [Ignatzschineria rhizosphaerae]UNM96934.1 hypothetical protein MMG00_03520 [Ignatzschineria rhizosphaerae]